MTTDKKYTILFVDDEKRILTALKSIFRRQYTVHIASSGKEALEILASTPVDVIVSDQRMPHMLGHELLAQVHRLYPKTMRLLLTGFMDKQAIIDTINEGEIYRFINKPWNNDDIQEIIAEAALASEFEVDAPTDSHQIPITPQAGKSSASTSTAAQLTVKAGQGVLMMGSNQDLRNQIRTFCRQNDLKIYGTQTIPQAVGVVSASESVGVAIIELPFNTDEAIQTISLLKEKRPELISIVLTEETDAETAVELINSGQVFRYLEKPLEETKLTSIIAQAFTRHNRLKSNTAAQQRYRVQKSSQSITSSIKDLFSSFGLSRKHS